MYGLETLIKLNNQVERGGLCVVFVTVLLPRAALRTVYPGGVQAFLARYPNAREDGGLVAVSAMSGGEIGEIVDELGAAGLEPGRDLAVCDQFAGPMLACPHVDCYVSRPDRPFAQRWKAVLRNEPDSRLAGLP